jgi:hypothetical protein
MRMRFVISTVRAAAFLALLATPVLAQTTVCRAASDDSENMMTTVKQYALATDPSWVAARDSLRIPGVSSATSVVLITKENTCKTANTAYQAAATGATQTLSGRVFVVQVGTSYAVYDPGYRFKLGSGQGSYMVFDSHWALKRKFVP